MAKDTPTPAANPTAAAGQGEAPKPPFNLISSRLFPGFLADQKLALAISMYQSGKLFFLGLNQQGRLSAFERTFNRCMGLWTNGQTLWLAAAFQLWRLENMLKPGELADGYDRLYVPQVGYTTGDIDVHDLAVDKDGRLIFVSTLFCCLATLSDRYSFEPVWKPKFISRLAAEDRCHLNGLAMQDGEPRYVTACSTTNIGDGWRDHRAGGGVVIDVQSGEVIVSGLSMPHSPRVYRDKLWMLDSGNGQFGYVDLDAGKFVPVAFCPGYCRGLAFIGDYALVGTSKPRDHTFSGLPLDEHLKKANVAPRCGLQVINLNTGDSEHWVRIEGPMDEIYDVVTLPGAVRPKAFGFKTEEIQRHVWTEEEAGTPSKWVAVAQS